MGYVTITMPFLGVVYHSFGETCTMCVQNLTALASAFPEIVMGPPKLKMGHMT